MRLDWWAGALQAKLRDVDNIPQAMAGCDSFKQGTDMVVLASQEDHCGAAGQDGFEVTSAKTSYKVVTGDQV